MSGKVEKTVKGGRRRRRPGTGDRDDIREEIGGIRSEELKTERRLKVKEEREL